MHKTLLLLAVAVAAVAAAGAVSIDSDTAVFLSIGDWGDGSDKQGEVAHALGDSAASVKPQFIVSNGDNFYNSGVTSVQDPQWEAKFTKMYATPALQVPWWAVLGNHDYIENPQAEVEYTTQGADKRWNMPARYYNQTFTLSNGVTMEYFFLDTIMLGSSTVMKVADEELAAGEINQEQYNKLHATLSADNVPISSAEQLAWLKGGLAESTATWKFVVGHFPVYSGGSHGDTAELVEQVLPLLEQYKVDAYFSGHDHTKQVLKEHNVRFYLSGGGCKEESFVWPLKQTLYGDAKRGFMIHTVTADKMVTQVIDDHGTLKYTDTITPQSAR